MKKIKIIILISLSILFLSLGAIFFYNNFVREPRFVKDPQGKEILCKRVNIGFNESATQEMINSTVKSVQGEIVMSIPEISSYQISIPGRCDAETVFRAIEVLEKIPGVEFAEPSYAIYLQ